ncbi:hypothetical protein ACHAPF_010633 [Botrytis cinerea]
MAMNQRNGGSVGELETPSEGERQTPGHTSQNGNGNPHYSLPLGNSLEEAPEVRIERLGRQRPEVFKSLWAEIGFTLTVEKEYFVSGFTVILPTLVSSLGIPSASATWPASAFSLTLACFLLVFGRLSDMYGSFPAYVAGFIWLALWSLIGGFSTDLIMLNFCRALQGLGPAMYLPSSVALIGIIYRPGPRKNLVFAIYGACAPLGFFVGIFFAGLIAEYTHWGWWFWIGCVLAVITAITSYLTIPSDIAKKRNVREARQGTDDQVRMDWWGAVFIVVGLILFTFAIIDSAHAPNGWKTPYIYVLFIVGSLLLFVAAYIEMHTRQALIPSSFFKVPSMVPLVFALFLCYGSLGIFLLYATFYMTGVMGGTPLQLVAWYAPMALGGCIISTLGGFVLHLLPGTALIVTAGVAWIVAPLLFAIAPSGANYQGLAGSMVMLILHLGIAVCLGFSDIINTYTLDRLGLRQSYHAVFWFEVACAGVSLIIMALFVKIKRAESELTVDERMAAMNVMQLDQSTTGARNMGTDSADGADDGKLN